MELARALTQAAYVLEKISDEEVRHYLANARRLGTFSSIFHFWARQTWHLPFQVEITACNINSGENLYAVFQKTVNAIYAGVKKKFLSTDISSCDKTLLNPLLFIKDKNNLQHDGVLKIAQIFVSWNLQIDNIKIPEDLFCTICGSRVDDNDDLCEVCGGGKNQIMMLFDF